ncbi:LytR/AlgR family response regulator transcription factor [Clostridium cellulovorans]|uniref:LytR/AlgR family response regulator transcription factor n=1 Tax=Clostridium cellulovorans TaxID=1493 RepID=UPI0001E8EC92|nr:LytTR family DNA-binding domain-containing protein [Clostridium cellulovorans]
MLSIFVCEDNKEQRERITKAIENIVLIEELDMKLALATEKPDDIIDFIKENNGVGLYFLDIDLKATINGIELATKIREYDPRGFIVFVTTHAEMSYLTFIYKVEAMDYIIKDNYRNIKERVHQCILDANKKYSTKSTDLQKIFSIKVDDRIINIEYSKILFFETSSTIHKVIVHAMDRQIEFYGKMKEIEAKLDSGFYRCHKSYIVNKENIKEIDLNNRCIHMVNGERCLISTRMLKGLIE